MDKGKLYKVIVVEDEALIRHNITKKIHELNTGFEVIGEAMDGKSALALIEATRPHLVITDIQMPIMNGLELAKNIYYKYPQILIVIISGFSEFNYARKAIEYQVKDYLLKPINSEELLEVMTKIKLQLDANLDSLTDIVNSKNDSISPENLIQAVELYIRSNYTKDLTVEAIAKSLNFSPDYLSRVYKKYTGQTPLKYLIHLRINTAKQILDSNDKIEIKNVGEMVGYPDQYYFSRIFKTHTGYYPSEYRTHHKI